MQLDSKDKKKATIKNKSSESNKVSKNKEKTNVDKSKSIDKNFKSPKEADIKKTPENNGTKNINLSNL